jgi:hypothetical protein
MAIIARKENFEPGEAGYGLILTKPTVKTPRILDECSLRTVGLDGQTTLFEDSTMLDALQWEQSQTGSGAFQTSSIQQP